MNKRVLIVALLLFTSLNTYAQKPSSGYIAKLLASEDSFFNLQKGKPFPYFGYVTVADKHEININDTTHNAVFILPA